MRKRLASRVLAAAALATFFAVGVFPGTASASTVLAQGCTGAVIGSMGDQVAVQGRDLADLVKAGAAEQETMLRLNGVDSVELAQEISDQGALTVGRVPNSAVTPLTGEEVAAAVTHALGGADGLGWDADQKQKTLASITSKVAGNCGLTLYAGNYSAEVGSPATPPVPGTLPAGPPPPLPPAGTAPQRDYGNVPATAPWVGGPPGANYPVDAPSPRVPTPGQPDVHNTGNASALASGETTTDGTRLPMMLAVVALAGVTAALVRTWVLRKAS